MLTGTKLSGDASRYDHSTEEYFHIDTTLQAVPYSLPGGLNPRYGGKASPPDIIDTLEGLSACSPVEEGPNGTERFGRMPESVKEVEGWRWKGQGSVTAGAGSMWERVRVRG